MRALCFLALAALAAPAAPAAAQNGERWNDSCNDLRGRRFQPDERVLGCTTLIESHTLSVRNLAYALHNRGLALRAQGQLRRAIADFRRALRLAPDHGPARAALCEAVGAAGGPAEPGCAAAP
jgi:tetratricopeptide (TPR) repeat protein